LKGYSHDYETEGIGLNKFMIYYNVSSATEYEIITKLVGAIVPLKELDPPKTFIKS